MDSGKMVSIAIIVSLMMVLLYNFAIEPLFYLIVGKVKVPNVIMMNMSQARAAVATKGLDIFVIDVITNPDYPDSTIIAQIPAGGYVKQRSYIGVIINVRQVEVPDILNKTLDEARAILKNAGLSVEDVQYAEKPDPSKGGNVVLDVKPSVGSKVSMGSGVVLIVNPEMAEVPKVIGLGVSRAEEILKQAGFKVVRRYGYSDWYDPGFVYAQKPRAGQKALKGSKVIIWIATEEEEY